MRMPPESLEAYDCYLRGLDLFLRFTQAKNAEARHLIDNALVLDPHYARAFGLLAWSHLQDVFMAWTNDPIQSLGQAFELAQKALALDSKDNRSHWVQGAVYLYQRQFERSAAAYQRALTLNANDADVIAQYTSLPLYTGKFLPYPVNAHDCYM